MCPDVSVWMDPVLKQVSLSSVLLCRSEPASNFHDGCGLSSGARWHQVQRRPLLRRHSSEMMSYRRNNGQNRKKNTNPRFCFTDCKLAFREEGSLSPWRRWGAALTLEPHWVEEEKRWWEGMRMMVIMMMMMMALLLLFLLKACSFNQHDAVTKNQRLFQRQKTLKKSRLVFQNPVIWEQVLWLSCRRGAKGQSPEVRLKENWSFPDWTLDDRTQHLLSKPKLADLLFHDVYGI